MTTEQAPARRARRLQRAVILAIVLVAAYGLPALWPEVRTAVAGVAEIAPAVMLAALVLETASLACFSGLTVSLLGRARRPRFGTLLRIDVTVYGLSRVLPRRRGDRRGAAAAAADRGRGPPPRRGVPGDDRGHRIGAAALHDAGRRADRLPPAARRRPPPVVRGGRGRRAGGRGVRAAQSGDEGRPRTAALVDLLARWVPGVDPDRVGAALRREGEHLRALAADPPRLVAAIVWGAANWLLDATVLWVVLAAVGQPVDPLVLFIAYAVANVLGLLPITPGGVGVVEGVLCSSLVAAGVPAHLALVGVLGWRLVNYWLPIPVGALLWLTLRHHVEP